MCVVLNITPTRRRSRGRGKRRGEIAGYAMHTPPPMADHSGVADGGSAGNPGPEPHTGPQTSGPDAAAVWRLHEAAEQQRRRAGKWFTRPNARREVREAQQAEQRALERLGFDTFEAFAAAHPSPALAPPAAETRAAAPAMPDVTLDEDATMTRITEVLTSLGVDPGDDPLATAEQFLATHDTPDEPELADAFEPVFEPVVEPAASTPAPPEPAAEREREPELVDVHAAELADTQSRLDEAVAELDRTRAELRGAWDEVALAQERIEQLTATLRERSSETEAARAELGQLRQRVAQLEGTVSALEESIRVRTGERDEARAALERETAALSGTRAVLAELEHAAGELRDALRVTREELQALRDVAHADAERLLHHTVGETARLREEADATARDIVERAEHEADLIRREAHVTARGIREIAREDAQQLLAAAQAMHESTGLNDRIAALERQMAKLRKALKKRAK